MASAIQNAFVLGAGLGTRLRGLTARRPKPLIPICNQPLITFAFEHLLGAGVKKFVVNTHHRAEAYAEVFPEGTYRGAAVHFEHEPVLLETGGGIKNVGRLLRDGTCIVYNGDILTDLPLAPAIAHHRERGNEVTLVLRSHGGPLHIALDGSSGRVTDIRRLLGTVPGAEFLFTGISIIEPQFIDRIPAETKISVVPVFLEMIRRGAKLGGIVIDDGHWWDLGTREQYLDVHRFLKTGKVEASRLAPLFSIRNPQSAIRNSSSPLSGLSWIHPTAQVSPRAKITGATAIGPRAKVGDGAALSDCIVWEDAEIGFGSCLENCIVTAGQRVQGAHRDTDF